MQIFRARQPETIFQVQETGHNSLASYRAHDPALPACSPIPQVINTYGIRVLSDPPNATCDICFIHGLTGDRDKTWTADGQSTPWPGALLPGKLQQARILTYGYDAYVVSKSTASMNRLRNHATNLLVDLASDRESCNAAGRPLIFVAHSLGGLVCKMAILVSRNHPETHLQDVFNSLKGVVFMGTPHMGAWMANWAKIPATTFGFVKSVNVNLIDILQSDNELLESLQGDFLAMVRQVRENGRRLEVTCFFEELPTFGVGPIVSKESASFDGYAPRSIHADHRNMVKFATVEDNGFKRVLGDLVRWTLAVDKPPLINPKRNQHKLNAEDAACLQDLYTTDPRNDKTRIEKVKGGLLEESYHWIFENDDFKQWRYNRQSQLLWIRGDPGKGKTMLLCGIINELKSSSEASVVFFFCQATDARINHATAVLRGLIYMLVDNQPNLISHVRQQHEKAGKKGFEDVNAWETLSKIFSDILVDPLLQSTYVIIDALDECTKDRDLLLDLVVRKSSLCPHVKWIVSSRNWPDIEEALEPATQKATLWLELNERSVAEAVTTFIRHKVQELSKQKKYKAELRDAISQHLFSNAHGTFLWVALVCEELAKAARWNGNARSLLTAFPPGLESLYARMIQRIQGYDPADAQLCKRILGVILLVYRPITLDELPTLVDMPEDITTDQQSSIEIVEACGSFLTIREGGIFFVHQSAKDFLLQSATKEVFARGIAAEHYTIFFRSLRSFGTLRRDIYGLRSPGFPIDKVNQPDPDPLAAVRYSCLYWVDHLHDGNVVDHPRESDLVEEFLKHRYLFWLEAMSLMGHIPEGIAAIIKMDRRFQRLNNAKELAERVRDASRFIQYHRLAIECSPLQVYISSLIFSPNRSMIKACYQSLTPNWAVQKPVMEDNWSPCLQILEGHFDSVESIAWSKDGRLIASGSGDGAIMIWDPVTGRRISTLARDRGCVRSMKWSEDGRWLASLSRNLTIRVWDPVIGRCVSTSHIEKCNGFIISITWSKDGSLLVSRSIDRTIQIWEPFTGRRISTIEGHSKSIRSIEWSEDRSFLASGSVDGTVRIWDPLTGRCISTLEGHVDDVSNIAWSEDGSRLASGSVDGTVRIWDPLTGRCISTLEGHVDGVSDIAWSEDGSWLASGSRDGTVRIWEPLTGRCIATLKVHRTTVMSIAWSRDGNWLALVDERVIILWNRNTGSTSTLEGHTGSVLSIQWSRDGSQLISGSADRKVRIWDPTIKQGISTLNRHNARVRCVVWSRDGSRLASGSFDKRVMIWNPATGQCISILEGHGSPVATISWSRDGSQLATGSHDRTVKIWDVATETCVATLRIDSTLRLQFDEASVHLLHTDEGVVDLRSFYLVPTSLSHSPPRQDQGAYSCTNDSTWITFRGEHILWIPSEYRPCHWSFFPTCATTTVAIGCSTGNVLFLTLSNDPWIISSHKSSIASQRPLKRRLT